MAKDVSEAYESLWHYTTAQGLLGIIQNQELWATSIRFTNDAREFLGFFDRNLGRLVGDGVREGIHHHEATDDGRRRIQEQGGAAAVQEKIADHLSSAIRSATLKLEPFITSFCGATTKTSDDGLLSQWRGYGHDGGYALVFDTKGLQRLLGEEQEHWMIAHGHWGDVDYCVDDGTPQDAHEEAIEWEQQIRVHVGRATQNLLVGTSGGTMFEELFDPVVSLATRYKHAGFHEEQEVRIVVLPSTIEDTAVARRRGDGPQRKQLHFTAQGGLPIPRISLFNRPGTEKVALPIKKVVVGPHPDKMRRKKAVEMLVAENGLDAAVVASGIPFIGK